MNDHSNQLISEQFRIAGKAWVEADSAARLLEETKTAVLAQRMKELGDKPASHAEKARTSRIRMKHIGIKKAQSRPLGGTVASGWKRKFDGTVERR